MGESGSGKSASLRNFSDGEIGVFNVAGKPLPFRKKLKCSPTSDYKEIKSGIYGCAVKKGMKAFAIDDSQYLMCFEAFAKAKDTGYGKFTDMALNFYNLVKFVITDIPDDVVVYFLHHTEADSNTGR